MAGKKGRETQAIMRVGNFGIKLIPGNVIVGEMNLVATGPNAGTEVMSPATQTYHGTYYHAVCNLYDRLVKEETFNNNTIVVKGLIDAEKSAYRMIEDQLKRLDQLPDRIRI